MQEESDHGLRARRGTIDCLWADCRAVLGTAAYGTLHAKAVESVCMTGCERATAEALVRGRVRSGGAVRGVVVSERLWTGWGKPTVGVVG